MGMHVNSYLVPGTDTWGNIREAPYVQRGTPYQVESTRTSGVLMVLLGRNNGFASKRQGKDNVVTFFFFILRRKGKNKS